MGYALYQIALLILVLLGALSLYLLPSVVAYSTGHRNAPLVLLINFLFGVTVIGWVVALIWALKGRKH